MAGMNFDLADLRALVAVAKLGSFRAAAAELHLSQPALSRRIEKLEGALGVRLIDRTTRAVTLTDVGREFSVRTRELLDGLEESLLVIKDVAGRVTGEVTVACVPSAVRYFLPEVLKEYHERYPRILVRVIDEGANAGLSHVVRSEADFGINYIGTQEPNIEFEPILQESFVLACHASHPLASREQVTWAELNEHDYMTVAKTSGNRLLLDLALAGKAVRPRWFCEVGYVSSLVGLVEAGLGIAVVPRLAMPLEPHPTLVSVSLVEPTIERTVGLLRRRGRVLSPAAQKLYELLADARDTRLSSITGRSCP
jgi:DNA-binding transcriptional LysR family regulator